MLDVEPFRAINTLQMTRKMFSRIQTKKKASGNTLEWKLYIAK